MNLLRWILLGAGAMLFVGIYLWGRRAKRSVAELPPAKLQPRPVTHSQAAVPELVQEVALPSRAESQAIFSHHDDYSDSLPSMSAHGAPIVSPADARIEPQIADLRATPIERVASRDELSPRARDAVKPSVTASIRPITKPVAQRKIIALRLAAGAERVEGAQLKSLLEAAALSFGKYSIYHRMHDETTPLFSVASMVEPGTFDPFAMRGVQFPGVTIFLQLPGPIDGQEMLSQMLDCARQLEQGMGGLLQDERGLPLTEPRAQKLQEDVANFLHLLGSQ